MTAAYFMALGRDRPDAMLAHVAESVGRISRPSPS